jgi:L-aminopeptidase/D-esterase-like protein
MKGGVATWAARGGEGEAVVGALVVVNAVGDVRDAAGRIIAGARADDGTWLDSAAWLARGGPSDERFRDLAGRNTTLCVVATNAALDRAALGALARAASAALFRRITPVATPFDGDVIFATAPITGGVDARPAQVEALAVRALETAIERSVRAGAPGDILQ